MPFLFAFWNVKTGKLRIIYVILIVDLIIFLLNSTAFDGIWGSSYLPNSMTLGILLSTDSLLIT